MTFAELAVRSAFRNKLRTLLTSVGVAIAVVAFLFLRTVVASFTSGVENAAQDRLVVRNKIAIIYPLPLAYAQKIKSVPGVDDLSWSNWFGGIYKDPKNFFPRLAVDAESHMRMYPEFLLTDEERKAFLADRSGCIVGARTAEKYGFKVGDVIHMAGDIYPGNWDFNVRGIYRGKASGTDTTIMFFHWKYLDERVPERRKNMAGTFVVHVGDPGRSVAVGQAIDELFANSLNETRTESEKAFQLSFLSMTSTLVKALNVVALVMLLILTLILGNTMAMSTRERTSEYGVMRAIGFRPGHVIGLVLGEAAVVALVGFVIGVLIAPPVISGFSDWASKTVGSFLTRTDVGAKAIAYAGVAAVVGGVLATGIPAWLAGRLKIVDSLRRVE